MVRACGWMVGAIGLLLSACAERGAPAPAPRELRIFHAGSLSVPFRALSDRFEQEHPGVRILAEAAGSRDSARKVSELARPCDVLGSADAGVIQDLLIPAHTDFEIGFATNELVLAFTGRSRGADRIGEDNWFEVLLQEDVTFARSDPDSDPCGYRTLMLFQLAERHYQRPGLAARLRDKHGLRYVRPKETDLLALLEAGGVDYMFNYRSVALQHQLRILPLPAQVNLRDPARAALYQTAAVEVAGKRPGEKLTLRGAPIVYSVTIPRNAPNPALAVAYLELLLSEPGRAILEQGGQPTLRPALASDLARVPEALRRFCQ